MKYAAVLIVSMMTIFGCGNSPSAPPNSSTKSHTFTIQNHTSNAQTPKQLTRLEVIPVGGVKVQFADFLVNAEEEQNVYIAIPKAGPYQVTIYSSDDQSMWWDSVYLDLPGQSVLDVNCSVSGDFSGDCGGSLYSGTDMTP
jgi:hypothetical protein